MNTTTTLAPLKHTPDYNEGVLGCRGYAPIGIIALTAGDVGHFIQKGIVDGSIVFVQTLYPFEEDQVNVFFVNDEEGEHYKLSTKKISGRYVGQAVGAFTVLSS